MWAYRASRASATIASAASSPPSAAAIRRPASGAAGSRNAAVYGSSAACSSACGRSSIPPRTWQSLWCSAAARGERLAGEPRAREGGCARVRVARAAQRGANAARKPAQTLARSALGQRRGAVGPERLDAVRNGVHAAGAGDGGGEIVRQLGVVDDEAWHDGQLAARGLAAVLGHAPHGRQLGAGVRRRHRCDRQTVGERDRLREPDRRSPADRDEAVGAALARSSTRRLGVRGRNVHAHADDAGAGAERGEQPLGVCSPASGRRSRADEPAPAGRARPAARRSRRLRTRSGARPSRGSCLRPRGRHPQARGARR